MTLRHVGSIVFCHYTDLNILSRPQIHAICVTGLRFGEENLAGEDSKSGEISWGLMAEMAKPAGTENLLQSSLF